MKQQNCGTGSSSFLASIRVPAPPAEGREEERLEPGRAAGLFGESMFFEKRLMPVPDRSRAVNCPMGPWGFPKDFEINRFSVES